MLRTISRRWGDRAVAPPSRRSGNCSGVRRGPCWRTVSHSEWATPWWLHTLMAKTRVVGLVGPTAVGKTELSLELADRLGAEIVSVDSMQVYVGMDVGTAKVSMEERRRIPHHLIDIRPPEHDLTVAEF